MRATRWLMLILIVLAVTLPVSIQGYATYGKWSSSRVTYYVNPANLDLDPNVAEEAVQAGANAWAYQSSANFGFSYGGRVSDSATTIDHRNVVLFRNASNGGALATTYWWTSKGAIVDADIIFWDGAYHFFAGTAGCSGGAYIEDVATHEFGHALGLHHSTVGDATMYPSISLCAQDMRSLAADDIAGVQALYPSGGGGGSNNSAPSVSITAPANNSTVLEGQTVTLAGTATDVQDGNLAAQLRWSSSLAGSIGVGGTFTATLPLGSHVVTASVTDQGGMTTSQQIALTVVAPSSPTSPAVSLAARGYKVKGLQRVDLTWQGTTCNSIDIFRDGTRVKTVPNDGGETDAINNKGARAYSYRVCESGTDSCSSTVVVQF